MRHKSRQVTVRQTGKKKVTSLPKLEWIWRDVPHLRILWDELAEAVHRKLGLGAESFGRNRIIDEAVLGTVMATLFTDAFITDLTAEVNKRLAWITRQPIPSTKKLKQEIANEDRQLKRLTDRLAKLDDTHLDAVLAKAEEMGRLLAAKRVQLKELQRAGQRPNVKSVKEKDVVAALGSSATSCRATWAWRPT